MTAVAGCYAGCYEGCYRGCDCVAVVGRIEIFIHGVLAIQEVI
jgi:hypothetical protein